MAAQIHSYDIGSPSITLSVTEAGEKDAPAVLLLHGFPEIGYSWRHQITALADAGYRVIAPDQRGYGWSDLPDAVADYDLFALTGDAIALLDHLGVDDAVVVGHDWGSIVAWHLALFRPDRARGLVLMSVPYQPRDGASLLAHIRATDPEGPYSYMLAFQDTENPVEALLDADPVGTLRGMYWSVSGEEPDPETPEALPSFLSADEFENYCRAFARSGFGGGVNWYRNLENNWLATKPWHQMTISIPSMFVGGTADFVVDTADQNLGERADSMADRFADFRADVRIDGAGHWVQQEAPDEVNAALLEFLGGL